MKKCLRFYFVLITLTATATSCMLTPSAQVKGVEVNGGITARPSNSPDVLLLAVSGRCPIGCHSPEDNIDYLTPRGTVQAVASIFEARGLKVQSYAVAAHLTTHTPASVSQGQVGSNQIIPSVQQGFLQLEHQLQFAEEQWIHGRSNPTKVILLAHSHGVVWSHLLARAHPEIKISVMIDLDGVCNVWQNDNRQEIQSYISSIGYNPWNFNFMNPCNSIRVGHIRYDVKDIVFPNIEHDLEIQSLPFINFSDCCIKINMPFDSIQNIRLDGTRNGIETFQSTQETHSSISKPASNAMAWVYAQLMALSSEWTPTVDTVRDSSH